MTIQLDLFGAELRDAGAALALDAQEKDDPGWSIEAYRALINLAKRQQELHTDDLTSAFPREPTHFNAWGSIWLQAIRGGVIERTGRYRRSRDPKKHAHVYPIYRSMLLG